MKIATWNLERISQRSWKRLPPVQRTMGSVGADIWVLTESRLGVAPGPGFEAVHCLAHENRGRHGDERWASIWSHSPLRPIAEAPASRWSVAARASSDIGELIVYGTVLPWGNEPGDGPSKARKWEVQYREIERQGDEWLKLRSAYPSATLIVAGDFNQCFDDSNWYGTVKGRVLLKDRLQAAGLVIMTSADFVASGRLKRNHLIDHICLSEVEHSKFRSEITCWEPLDDDGVRMSDHPGVALECTHR